MVTFHGQPVTLNGQLPTVGKQAPPFVLTDFLLNDKTLTDFAGKACLLNIVPSLDGLICPASARKFNQKAKQFAPCSIITVSADLPFAQCRFFESEKLQQTHALSSFRSSFGVTYGVEIMDGMLRGLLTRALVLIDANSRVIYTQLVSELTQEPDYQAVLDALKDHPSTPD